MGCFTPGQFQSWAKVWGGWNNNSGNNEAPGDNETQWGIWGGVDYALNSNWKLGLAGGYFQSNMNFDSWAGVQGASIDYQGGQIAGYAAWDTGIWYNRGIIAGGFYNGTSHRIVDGVQSSPVDPSGSPDANAVSFYDEAGRRFAISSNATLTPFVGVTVGGATLESFTENDPGNTGAALRISSSDAESVQSMVGLRYNGTWGAFHPQVAVAWGHEFDDTFQTVNASFAEAPSGAKFKVISTDLGADSAVVDAGLSYNFGPLNEFSVRYVGDFQQDYNSNAVMGRWTYKWGGAPVAAAPAPIVNTPLK
jgi:uncharacterized protein with beta-barrel porin domain